jgi:hypothetical protein
LIIRCLSDPQQAGLNAYTRTWQALFSTEVGAPAGDNEEKLQQIHHLIEEGDMDGLRSLLEGLTEEERKPVVDGACPRTGLAPLHKAVESNMAAAVRVLIAHGADTASKAALYDDATPAELAARLQAAPEVVEALSTTSR